MKSRKIKTEKDHSYIFISYFNLYFYLLLWRVSILYPILHKPFSV